MGTLDLTYVLQDLPENDSQVGLVRDETKLCKDSDHPGVCVSLVASSVVTNKVQ